MGRLCSRQYVLAFVFFLLVSSQISQANPIVIDPLEIGLQALGYLFFDAFVDLVVLTCAFALVGEIIWLNLADFPRYFLAVVVGGLYIDLVALVVTHEQIAWGLLAVLLTAYNAYLCRFYFGFNAAKAACVGLAVGFFTNPMLWAFQQQSI